MNAFLYYGRRAFADIRLPRRQASCPALARRVPPFNAITRLQSNSAVNSTHYEPTIYALSTAPGRAAIAVIRISGALCQKIYKSLCPNRPLPEPRYAAVRALYQPSSASSTSSGILDSQALVLYFPGPKTVTGEDVLELHVHGGPAVVKAVLAAIPRCKPSTTPQKLGPSSIRYAEAGEFTRRAFLNGRMDLTQIEALGDTLAADTEQQRQLATRGASGGGQLSKQYDEWQRQLLYARGELEALIDFSEDQHFDESPSALTASVASQIRSLVQDIEAHRDNAVRGELLRNGISVTLLGAPNAGKSSLLNQVLGREAAIVSREAGTTRDVVEVGVDLAGWLVKLGDTAGLRGSEVESTAGLKDGLANLKNTAADLIGEVEQEGIKRAKARAFDSDVVIVVLSVTPSSNGDIELLLEPEVVTAALESNRKSKNVVVVVNKTDLISNQQLGSENTLNNQILAKTQAALPAIPAERIFCTSCKEATDATMSTEKDPGNIQAFLHGLISVFETITAPLVPPDVGQVDASVWQESLGASERHRRLLEECLGNLTQFLFLVTRSSPEIEGANQRLNEIDEDEIDIVVAAESLRAAAECLARITGRGVAGDVEQVLGVVFEK